MAFGFQPKGMFGRKPFAQRPMTQGVMPGDQPDYGMGDFPSQPMGTPDEMEAPQAKPGLFGRGGVGRAIAGTIGDTLLQHNGMAPVYAPTMQAQQEAAARQREASMKREQGREDWLFEQQWKRDNPTPTNNDTINDFNWYKNLSPEDQAVYHRMKPQYRVGADGLMYPVQVSQPVAAPAGVTFTPIVDGGPTQPASGSFPRR